MYADDSSGCVAITHSYSYGIHRTFICHLQVTHLYSLHESLHAYTLMILVGASLSLIHIHM